MILWHIKNTTNVTLDLHLHIKIHLQTIEIHAIVWKVVFNITFLVLTSFKQRDKFCSTIFIKYNFNIEENLYKGYLIDQ